MQPLPFLRLLVPTVAVSVLWCSQGVVGAGRWDAGAPALQAADRGHPWVHLEDGRFLGRGTLLGDLPRLAEKGQPISLVQGDFDLDGTPDLVVGSILGGKGYLQVWKGNPASLRPRGLEAARQREAGRDPSEPFFPPDPEFPVDTLPECLGVGDFDGDGLPDLAFTAPGSRVVSLLFGDGTGRLGRTRNVDLPGVVTAFSVGDVGHADGLADVMVGIDGVSGPQLLVLMGSAGIVDSAPFSMALPEPVHGIVAGRFDENQGTGIVAAASESIAVFSWDRSWGPVESPGGSTGTSGDAATGFSMTAEYRSARGAIAAVAGGDFLGDHTQELAIVFETGDIEFVSFHGPVPELALTVVQAVPSSSGSLSPASLPGEGWAGVPRPFLSRGRLSMLRHDDLVVGVPGDPGIRIILPDFTDHTEGVEQQAMAGCRAGIPPSGGVPCPPVPGVLTLQAAASPLAVLPMRLNGDGLHDLVLLLQGHAAPGISLSAGKSYAVTSSSDASDGNPGDGVCAIAPCSGGVCTGPCTFRAALDEANRDKQPSTITFSLAAGSTIVTDLQKGTYYSNEPLTIDGGQSGSGRPSVEINGNGYLGRGLVLRGADSVVRGLVMNGFRKASGQSQGILITMETGANNCLVAGNYLGVNQAGTVSVDPRNLTRAAVIAASSQNTIGGLGEDRNVIGGHDGGVTVSGTGNRVSGNYLGVNLVDGKTVRLNQGTSAEIGATGILVQNGNGNQVTGNVISGNSSYGISIFGGGSNLVQGNYLGTAIDGGKPEAGILLANVGFGINIEGSQGNQVGGAGALGNVIGTTGGFGQVAAVYIWAGWAGVAASGNVVENNLLGTDRQGAEALNSQTGVEIFNCPQNRILNNLISGNGVAGIVVRGGDAVGNEITGNRIGTGLDGATPLSNGSHGIHVVEGASGNLIQENTIAFSRAGNGVRIQSGSRNRISGNRVFGNKLPGIDLGVDGVTPNDPLDADTGPNQFQNFPVLTQVPGTSDLSGRLDSLPGSSFRIEIFSNEACHASGYGEGQMRVNSLTVQTDAAGGVEFLVSGLRDDRVWTATATDSEGNTSEFSACASVAGASLFLVNSRGDDPDVNWDPAKTAAQQTMDGVCSTGRKADGSPGPCDPRMEGDCECTLRAALQEANHRPGKDRVAFSIPGTGVQRLRPASPLPEVTDEVVIDGYSQPGSAEASASNPAALRIELDGSQAGSGSDGLSLATGNAEVRGLVVHSFDRHAVVVKGNANIVAGNYLGVSPTGTELRQEPGSQARIGIWVFNGRGNQIGGAEARDRNVIGGFTSCIQVFGVGATANQIHGNRICTNPAGDGLLSGNMCANEGIMLLEAPENQVGGWQPNIIGGTATAISMVGLLHSSLNRIQGNLIGTSRFGPAAPGDPKLGNWLGVLVQGHQNQIGGSGPGQGNAIANDAGFEGLTGLKGGILLTNGASGNRVQGNEVRDFDGYGIRIHAGATRNQIGGLDSVEGNSVSGNLVGILVQDEGSTGNRLLSNLVYDNQPLPVSLAGPAETRSALLLLKPRANDRNDLDTGPNLGQNSPEVPRYLQADGVVSAATIGPDGLLARTELAGRPNEDFLVQFYAASRAFVPDGLLLPYCGGERLLGSKTISTNAVGTGYGVARFPAEVLGELTFLTATATDSEGNTSEFGPCGLVETDTDGDGIPDRTEALGGNGGDSNGNGIPDAQEKQVAVVPVWRDRIGLASDLMGVETNARSFVLETLFSPSASENYLVVLPRNRTPVGWSQSVQILSGASGASPHSMLWTTGGGTQQAGASVLIFRLPAGLQVSGFYNYGPTPEDPVPHAYEFHYDGATGAKFFEDRIEVHFVDGARGDHDLTVNGSIETLGGPVLDAVTYYFPQLGNGLAGNIRFQSSLVFANAGGVSPVRIDLTDSANAYLDLDLEGLGRGSLFHLGLAPDEALSTQTSGTGPLQVGYAEVSGAVGVGGTAIFSRTDAARGVLLYETGVPASGPLTDFSVFVDTLGARDTGLALVYPRDWRAVPGAGQPDAEVTLRLYDKSFRLVGTRNLTLEPGAHLARFVPELFSAQAATAVEMEGVVTVSATQALAAVTLRQNDEPGREFPQEVPTLTAFPVIPGRADGPPSASTAPRSFYFAQIADGQAPGAGFRTSMIFVNTGPSSRVRIELLDSSGDPLTMAFGLGPASSEYEFDLAAGHSISLQSPGVGGLKVGYAKVTAGSQVAGTAVFTLADSATGILLYEAGVPAAEELENFSLVVDSRGHRRTGVALVAGGSDGSATTTLQMRLHDREGKVFAERELRLGAGVHYARFVNEIFPGVEGTEEMLGTLTVRSDGPVAAVTLRQTVNPALGFPSDVPTLCAFPVIPGVLR